MQEKRWAGLPAVALCAAATGVSYYLFARGVKLASGPLEADFCSAMFDVSCDSTLLSEYSKFLGMSFAGWGAAYYITLGVLLLASIGLRDLLHRQALSAAIVLNLGGLIVSGYLSWLMISGKVAICPLCFFTHLLNLALLPLLYLFRGSGPTSVRKDIGSGLTYIFAARGPSSTENTARTLAFVAVLLVGVASFEWFMLRSQPAPAESSAAPQQIIDNIMQAYLDENDNGRCSRGPGSARSRWRW